MLTKWYNSNMINSQLNPQQEQFVINYTSHGDYYNNAVLSYADAYNYTLKLREDGKADYNDSQYRVCNSNACRLLQNEKIIARIREIYLDMLNDSAVDARLSQILQKGKDADSVQAIKIHNDLKQRITKKIDITTAGRPLANLSDDELKALAE